MCQIWLHLSDRKNRTQRPQCILCSKIFANANLKASRLNKHFNNRQEGVMSENNFNTLKIKRACFDRSCTLANHGFSPVAKPWLQVPYQLAFLRSKKNKPHIIVEELVKPCAVEKAQNVLGTEAN